MNKELDKFQGRWELIRLEKGGVAASAREIYGTSIIFTDKRFVEKAPDYEFLGRISLYPGESFAEVDMNVSVNCVCDKSLKGIYAWEGDLLKICFSEDGVRPDLLDSRPGTGWTLKVLRKTK